MRTCTCCGNELDESQFYYIKKKNYRLRQCKSCVLEKQKMWRQDHQESYREQNRRRNLKNKDKIKANAIKYYRNASPELKERIKARMRAYMRRRAALLKGDKP